MNNFSKKAAIFCALLLLTGCTSFKIKSIRDDATATPAEPISSNFVSLSANGLFPQNILVSAGETVTFQNLDSKPHEVASDPYPDDNILPDFHSTTIYKGETYQYTFTKIGTFGYHFEDNPSIKGKIVVE